MSCRQHLPLIDNLTLPEFTTHRLMTWAFWHAAPALLLRGDDLQWLDCIGIGRKKHRPIRALASWKSGLSLVERSRREGCNLRSFACLRKETNGISLELRVLILEERGKTPKSTFPCTTDTWLMPCGSLYGPSRLEVKGGETRGD